MLELIASITEILFTAGFGGKTIALFVAIQAVWLGLVTLGSVGLALRFKKSTPAHVEFDKAKQDKRYARAIFYGLMTYAANNWLAIDRAMYSKWLGGDPNGTLSGGIGKAILAGHNNPVFRVINAVLSFFDPVDPTDMPDGWAKHMDLIGLDHTHGGDVELYVKSHCIRSINPYAGRNSGWSDRRIWQ